MYFCPHPLVWHGEKKFSILLTCYNYVQHGSIGAGQVTFGNSFDIVELKDDS